jgi:hypothetical protein
MILTLVALPPLGALLVWLFARRWPTWLKVALTLYAAFMVLTWIPYFSVMPGLPGQPAPTQRTAPPPRPAPSPAGQAGLSTGERPARG